MCIHIASFGSIKKLVSFVRWLSVSGSFSPMSFLHFWVSMCCAHVFLNSYCKRWLQCCWWCCIYKCDKLRKFSFIIASIAYELCLHVYLELYSLPSHTRTRTPIQLEPLHCCLRAENDDFNLIGLLVARDHDVRRYHITFNSNTQIQTHTPKDENTEKITFDRRSFNLNCFIIIFYKRIAGNGQNAFLIVWLLQSLL